MDALGFSVEKEVIVDERSRSKQFLTAALTDQGFRRQLVERVRSTGGSGVDSENIVHEVFLRTWLRPPILNDEKHAYNYVRRAVRNYCIDQARAAAAHREDSLAGTDHPDKTSLFETILTGERLSKLRMALAPADQSVLDRCVGGESPKEIATALGTAQKAVYDSIYRIIKTGRVKFRV